MFKTLKFWFLVTLNNIDQLQRSVSCIWMSDISIWVGKIRPRILSELHKCISCFWIDNYPLFSFISKLSCIRAFCVGVSGFDSNSICYHYPVSLYWLAKMSQRWACFWRWSKKTIFYKMHGRARAPKITVCYKNKKSVLEKEICKHESQGAVYFYAAQASECGCCFICSRSCVVAA